MTDINSFYIELLLLPTLLFCILVVLYGGRGKLANHQFARLVAWNGTLTLLLISVIFIIAESHFRFAVDTTDSFGINKLTVRWGERHYRFNNFGVRDNIDYNNEIVKGKRRLTIIGDSFTAGHGVKNLEDRFAQQLRKKFPSLEIHVMAYNGFETSDEQQLLSKLARQGYDFDLVLLVYCLNDISYLTPETEAIYDRIYGFNKSKGYLADNSYFINSMMFRWFAMNNPEITNYYDFVIEGYDGKSWAEQKRILHAMNDSVSAFGGTLGVVTFPFLNNLGEPYPFTKVHHLLIDFWTSRGVPNLDLLPVFQARSTEQLVVNKYDAHPNETAHAIAAETIGDFITFRMNLHTKQFSSEFRE